MTSGKRVRGFATWNPRAETKQTIDQCRAILEAYRLDGILPITLRQLFYRMVVLHDFPKTEKAYSRLGEYVNRARRAEMISMDWIRDDGFTMSGEWWYGDQNDFWRYTEGQAESFTLDRQAGQDRRILIWCEASGMRPQLETVGREFAIRAVSSGGFDSTSTKHSMAEQLADEPHTVLHLGDFDPSGVHMCSSLDEDLQAFLDYYGGDLDMVRLAVTPEHIEELELPTAPPKSTDNRSFDNDLTTQCEAIDPKKLAEIVRDAIKERLDLDVLKKVIEEKKRIRPELLEQLSDLSL